MTVHRIDINSIIHTSVMRILDVNSLYNRVCTSVFDRDLNIFLTVGIRQYLITIQWACAIIISYMYTCYILEMIILRRLLDDSLTLIGQQFVLCILTYHCCVEYSL